VAAASLRKNIGIESRGAMLVASVWREISTGGIIGFGLALTVE
jgi:hypothetical protein